MRCSGDGSGSSSNDRIESGRRVQYRKMAEEVTVTVMVGGKRPGEILKNKVTARGGDIRQLNLK